jgi:hypothetical protein
MQAFLYYERPNSWVQTLLQRTAKDCGQNGGNAMDWLAFKQMRMVPKDARRRSKNAEGS